MKNSNKKENLSAKNRNHPQNRTLQQNKKDSPLKSKLNLSDKIIQKNQEDQQIIQIQTNIKKQTNQQNSTFLYKPGAEFPNLFEFLNLNIKIIISSQYMTKKNPEYIKRHLFGNQVYSANSDAFCIAIHTGAFTFNTFNLKKYAGIQLIFKILKTKKVYSSFQKNNITSKNLKNYTGMSLKLQSFKSINQLPPSNLLQKYASNMIIPLGKKRIKLTPVNYSQFIPIPQTHMVFNMNNDPAYKYCLPNIIDFNLKSKQFSINKINNYCMYLECDGCKYEIYKKVKNDVESARFALVKHPEKADIEFFQKQKIPLNDDLIEIIWEDLKWEEIIWSNESIFVKNKEYKNIKSFKYYKISQK